MSDQLTLMVVHAHPDDEVIGTGGTFMRYGAEGVRTVLVTATLGEEGQIVDAELNTPEIKARLGEVRLEELRRAVDILGIDHLELLGYRDSGMAGEPCNDDPACFNKANMEEATERLVRLVRAYRPQVLVSYNEVGGYGHPDHIACHKATVAAFAAAGDAARFPAAGEPWTPLKLYYTASPRSRWLRMFERLREMGHKTPLDNPDYDITRFTVPDEQVTTEIVVGDFISRKRDALLAHRTQIAPDGPFFALPEEISRGLSNREFFVLAESRVALPPRDGREDDLFAGVRA